MGFVSAAGIDFDGGVGERDYRPATLRRPPRGYRVGMGQLVVDLRDVDPLLVRVAFVVAALAGGLGFVLYAFGYGWVAIPADEHAPPAGAARMRTGRGSVEVALGVGFLLLSVLLGFRELGLWFSDALVWPGVLVASGAALLWRVSAGSPQDGAQRAEAPDTGWSAPTATPADAATERQSVEEVKQRAAVFSRTSLGIALVVAAGLAFLQATGALSAARDVVLAALVVAVVLGDLRPVDRAARAVAVG